MSAFTLDTKTFTHFNASYRKQHIQPVIAGRNSPKPFEIADQSLNLITPLIKFSIILPWLKAIALGRNDRN